MSTLSITISNQHSLCHRVITPPVLYGNVLALTNAYKAVKIIFYLFLVSHGLLTSTLLL